jgi:hypothetical protein
MEEFFKDLFFDFSGETTAGGKIAGAYTALIDIYRRVISETTDWINEDGRQGGPVGRLIAHAVDSSDSVTLMTFNQDLVLTTSASSTFLDTLRLVTTESDYGS